MGYAGNVFALTAGLFVGILLCFLAGRRAAIRFATAHGEKGTTGSDPTMAAVFGLLGLLLALTFYGAAERMDHRRALIVDEANAIGTAYLRLDLLPSDLQPEIRESFRQYLDSRLEFYKSVKDSDRNLQIDQTSRLREQIWTKAVSASRASGSHEDAGKLLLPALNAMFDIATTRLAALHMHPPTIIFVMLFGFALISSVLAGGSLTPTNRINRINVLAFAAVMAIAVYVILDLEYPRLGLIRVDAFDRFLIGVRTMMH